MELRAGKHTPRLLSKLLEPERSHTLAPAEGGGSRAREGGMLVTGRAAEREVQTPETDAPIGSLD